MEYLQFSLISIFFFLIIFSIIPHNYSYIILPIKSLDFEITIKSVEDFIRKYSYLYLYSDFYLDKSELNIPVFFTPLKDYFYLSTTLNDLLTDFSLQTYNPSLLSGEQLHKIVEYSVQFITNQGELNNIYSEIDYEKIDLVHYKNYDHFPITIIQTSTVDLENDNMFGILGLLRSDLSNNPYNFLTSLKKLNIINNTIWSVSFSEINNTIGSGNLIIGEYPHIYSPNYYKEKNYYTIKNNNTFWEFKVNSAYILKKNHIPSDITKGSSTGSMMYYIENIRIEFGAYLAYAPKDLFDQLRELFFEKYFDENICTYKKVKIQKDKIQIIFCDASKFGEYEQKQFPTLYFNVEDFHINFEINNEDVFLTKNDAVFLMIAFDSKENRNYLKVGNKFLEKYQFTFDYDKNEIGFYNNNVSMKKEMERIRRYFSVNGFVFLLLVSGALLCACYYLKIGCFKKRKILDFNFGNKNIKHLEEGIEQSYELADKFEK